MEVILLENIKNLGKLGNKVKVKAGYSRNFLIPQGKAVFATQQNIELFEQRRAELEKKAQQTLSAAEQRAAKLNDTTIVLSAMASEEGKLYGSIGANEIKDALQAKSIEVTKREIVMPEGAIHSVGNFMVEVHVHSDVVANLQVQVTSAK